VVEDADEAALIPFAPKFGMVCQTGISRRRAGLVAEALRQRHPDSRMVFLDTTSPALLERERSVEALSRWAEVILVAGEAGEASVRALVDASRRLGLPAFPVADAGALDRGLLAGAGRIGLTAGEFSPDLVIAARLETEG
jgi:4-hydroxy-3-methylbut-2-enyl diphosphate reductase IspH